MVVSDHNTNKIKHTVCFALCQLASAPRELFFLRPPGLLACASRRVYCVFSSRFNSSCPAEEEGGGLSQV